MAPACDACRTIVQQHLPDLPDLPIPVTCPVGEALWSVAHGDGEQMSLDSRGSKSNHYWLLGHWGTGGRDRPKGKLPMARSATLATLNGPEGRETGGGLLAA